MGSKNPQWGPQSSRLETRSLELQCGRIAVLDTGLAVSFSGGWEPTLEAIGSGQVLLCACLAHKSLDWVPDGLAVVQGQAWVAKAVSGGLFSTQGTQRQGCLAAVYLVTQSLLCLQEPCGL